MITKTAKPKAQTKKVSTRISELSVKGLEDSSKLDLKIYQNNVANVSNSGRFTDLDVDKLRGGYYTPGNIADWLVSWAIRNKTDRVLEPSCGDGAFIEASVRRFVSVGSAPLEISRCLRGLEIVEEEANKAREKISKLAGVSGEKIIQSNDFFSWFQESNERGFDAVVGNPPFIRYQTFPEPYRARAMEIMVSLGMKPNKLTNIWVPFVAASAACLRPGGRMALIIPAELLQVTYAAQLRSFLTDKFERIDVIACNELFFEKAEQEVVLLLAEGAVEKPSADNLCRVTLSETDTVKHLVSYAPEHLLSAAVPKKIHHDSEKWLKYFLTQSEIDLMRTLRDSHMASPLSEHASVDVGVVTGKNEFFVLNSEQVQTHGLDGYTIPVVSRSSQMKGAFLTKDELNQISVGKDRVHLLHLKPFIGKKLSKSLLEYIHHGEQLNFHKGYKCSIRSPWYVVPSVWSSEGLFFRQIYDFPRVVQNLAGATTTDTIHRLRTTKKVDDLISNIYTHLTGASAEIEGRSYGGGVLELEPTEAERLLVPTILQKGLPMDEIDRMVRAGRIEEVLEINDRLILMDGLGLSRFECDMLKGIWVKMRDRRMSRKRRSVKTK